MSPKRTIAVVSTSRADYSHLVWVLRELRARPELQPRLIVTGAQLAEEFGHGADEIDADGFPIDERVECLLDSDSDVGMAKTIGIATLGLAEVLGRMRPDLLLLLADRYELLAPAAVALALRVPIAHIEGGEVSEGAIDDAVRHALTKLSHLHFTPTESARRRVLGLGEEAWRVHRTGAPSLDHLRRSELLSAAGLAAALGGPVDPRAVLVAIHPVTIARETLREADAVFAALEQLRRPIEFCFPNADAGGRELIRRAERFCVARAEARLHVNLNPRVYWSLLRAVALMLGNSSSGIMETPALELPTVNVGLRQQGRERARNVLDAPAETAAILATVERALDPGFRAALSGMANPYGDGHAAERIAAVLVETPLGERLLHKRALPMG
ncbi:MAG TPA: UDP-N-acetylglucosamine 2-epimerase [Candidatus Polarisedimenticolaceae bacterium]|nr:UDP-N-acetylglucosamine 2-epimerase [Candidatus Polarisedimenticolaceae bacterium]